MGMNKDDKMHNLTADRRGVPPMNGLGAGADARVFFYCSGFIQTSYPIFL